MATWFFWLSPTRLGRLGVDVFRLILEWLLGVVSLNLKWLKHNNICWRALSRFSWNLWAILKLKSISCQTVCGTINIKMSIFTHNICVVFFGALMQMCGLLSGLSDRDYKPNLFTCWTNSHGSNKTPKIEYTR